VLFQGVLQGEAVINDDVLRCKCCFGEMETVIARVYADLIMLPANLNNTFMYKNFIIFHNKTPKKKIHITHTSKEYTGTHKRYKILIFSLK